MRRANACLSFCVDGFAYPNISFFEKCVFISQLLDLVGGFLHALAPFGDIRIIVCNEWPHAQSFNNVCPLHCRIGTMS